MNVGNAAAALAFCKGFAAQNALTGPYYDCRCAAMVIFDGYEQLLRDEVVRDGMSSGARFVRINSQSADASSFGRVLKHGEV